MRFFCNIIALKKRAKPHRRLRMRQIRVFNAFDRLSLTIRAATGLPCGGQAWDSWRAVSTLQVFALQ